MKLKNHRKHQETHDFGMYRVAILHTAIINYFSPIGMAKNEKFPTHYE